MRRGLASQGSGGLGGESQGGPRSLESPCEEHQGRGRLRDCGLGLGDAIP